MSAYADIRRCDAFKEDQHGETQREALQPGRAAGKKVWVARYTSHDGRRLSAGTFARKGDAQERDQQRRPRAARAAGERGHARRVPAAMARRAPGVSERTMQIVRGRIRSTSCST